MDAEAEDVALELLTGLELGSEDVEAFDLLALVELAFELLANLELD